MHVQIRITEVPDIRGPDNRGRTVHLYPYHRHTNSIIIPIGVSSTSMWISDVEVHCIAIGCQHLFPSFFAVPNPTVFLEKFFHTYLHSLFYTVKLCIFLGCMHFQSKECCECASRLKSEETERNKRTRSTTSDEVTERLGSLPLKTSLVGENTCIQRFW